MKKIALTFALMLFAFASALASDGYKIGDIVPDFSLKNIDNTMVSLSQYKQAKGFIVIFTCNHCPYSKLYEDRIIALDKEFASKGFPVIAINPNDDVSYPDDSFENMKVRAKEKGFTFPYLRDETQEVAKHFGATRTPHVFLLQKVNNQLKLVYIGAIDDNSQEAEKVSEKYVENAIKSIVSGAEVKPETTKAIGCSIKWKK